jgi:CheY-like chemotaxis protein
VLDLNLPKNDGIEVLEAMRKNPVFAEVPVAILSSSSSARERAKLQALRVERWLTKPSDLEEFMGIGLILKALLENGRSLRHASAGGSG